MNNRQFVKIIENYIHAYNSFDIDRMLQDMDDKVRFENISGGEVNLATDGIVEFRKQAEQSKAYFKEREQKIVDISFDEDTVEVEIEYRAVLATDFPNGLKEDDKVIMKGKSVFKFKDNRIVELKDIS